MQIGNVSVIPRVEVGRGGKDSQNTLKFTYNVGNAFMVYANT
jgi:hypothetical protein